MQAITRPGLSIGADVWLREGDGCNEVPAFILTHESDDCWCIEDVISGQERVVPSTHLRLRSKEMESDVSSSVAHDFERHKRLSALADHERLNATTINDLLSDPPAWLFRTTVPSAALGLSALQEFGLLTVINPISVPVMLPAAICNECLRAILSQLDEALSAPIQQTQHLFGRVRSQSRRYDFKLGLDCLPVGRVVRTLVAVFWPVLQAAVGRDALLVELSAITTEPGASAQKVHSDTNHGGLTGMPDTALLLTMFVCLHDVLFDSGPTVVHPGTHTLDFHRRFYSSSGTDPMVFCLDRPFCMDHGRCSSGSRGVHLTLPQGSVCLMDSRLFHCGGANMASGSTRRTILVVSWLQRCGSVPNGSTYSIRDDLAAQRLTLDVFCS